MVYKIIWTLKALRTYENNMGYLEKVWTEKEAKQFALLVEKKLILLCKHPNIGIPRNKKQATLRYTILHKRVSLIYRVKPQKKEIELIHFWNTYQNPARLKTK